MTKPPILLAHGWGFDASMWDALLDHLPGRQVFRVEQGYLGAAPAWPDVPAGTILVGHSAGVAALLRRPPPGCAGLVAINGFTRFLAADGMPGTPDRVLRRMQTGFSTDPALVLGSFRARCGDDSLPGRIVATRLADGLAALRDADQGQALRSATFPLLALAAMDDPIIPPGHMRACFGASSLRWSESGGHLLPVARPDWCAEMIESLPC